MDIKDNLIHLREELRISQEELGAKIGLSRFSISNYESGKRNITDRVIQDICREFNVNENWLRYNTGDMFDTVSDYEEMMAHIGRICSDDDEYKKMILKAAVNVIDNDVCWEVIKNELDKIINSIKKE